MNTLRTAAVTLTSAIILNACSQPDEPRIAMCQNLAENLLSAPIASWTKTEKLQINEDHIQVNLHFPTGVASCNYGRSTVGAEDEYGKRSMSRAPSDMTLNGQEVPARELMTAVAKSNGKLFKESAKASTEKAKEFATNADENLKNLGHQASEMAEQVSETAREAALKATESLQDKLQK